MTDSLADLYQKGAITADHLVVECFRRIDPMDPALVLGALPGEILTRMLDFASRYRPAGMVTNYGVLPTVAQVEAAKAWIEKAPSRIRDGSAPVGSDWDRDPAESRVRQILESASDVSQP
jgi:hypothetical protein